MAHLVAYHTANAAIVGRVVGVGVEEGRLQDGGGEANLVGGGVVVGVDGLRSHAPFHLVHALVDVARDEVVGGPAADVAEVLVEAQLVVHLQSAIVFPLVGIANLDDEVGELVLGLFLGGLAHPCRGVDALGQGLLQVVHELQHALLARLGEVLLHVELADGLSHVAADQAHGPFPARAVLLDAAHDGAEFERGLAEVVAQASRRTADDAALGVGLQVFEGRVVEYLLHLVDGFGLAHVHGVDGGESAGQQHIAPVDSRIVGHQLEIAHLVVVGVDVAQLHVVVAGLGNAGLDGEHGLHLLLCRGLVVAREHEELLQIVLVGLEHALVLCVVGEVVVAGSKSESGLSQRHEVPVGIAHVASGSQAEHHGSLAVAVELGAHDLVFLAVFDGLDAVEVGLDGCPSLAVEAHAVHHQVVERANLLSERAFRLWRGGILHDDVLDALLVLFVEVSKGSVVGVFGIEGVGLEPSSCRIMVKVVARSDRGVQVGWVDSRSLRLCKPCRGHKSHCCENKLCFHAKNGVSDF